MIHTKTGFLTTFLFLIIAIPFSVAQINTNSQTGGKTIYNFPPPMNDPSFPFKVVTIDENTPEWAKMIYQVNPNMEEAGKLYFAWKAENPDIKNGHTRNFRKLSGYLAQNKYINEAGFIDIPTNEEVKAESAKILKDRAKFKRQQKQSTARNSTNNTTWELVGPTFKKTTSGNLVDRHINVYSITQSLSNKDILYCATESGGTVFKTINHGDTWFSVSDNLITSMGARNIEVAPSNPDIVYLCTRDDVFKTTTGNDNWVSTYNEYRSNNRTLIIHPTNPNIVLTGGDKGILKTIDGGANWTNPLPAKSIYDLRYKPGDTQIIYALVKNASTNLTEFYKSTDAGETWTIRTIGWPMESANSTNGGQMTTSDGNDNYIYAFIGATWTASNNSRNIKIMKSLDYGESWTTAVDYDNAFGINSGQGYYDWDIEMSDINPDVVYGGTQGRWVTKDGFQTINQDIGSLGHSDVQETLFNGTDLWVVNDGGIILFDDENFQNYTPKSIGLNSISYWSFDQGWNKDVSSATHYHNGTSAMSENYEVYVGVNFGGAEPSFSLVAQPSGDKIVSKGYGSVNGYTMPDTQDGTYNRFSYNLTPNTHSYNGNNVGVHPLAYETHFLGVENVLLKSEDFGVTWDTLYKFPFAGEKVWDIELTRANTDAIFVTTIYSGGGNLYRSLDGGKSFTEIPLPNQFSNNPSILNASISNEDANIFYVMGDRYGIKIAKTVDGGATWIDLDTPTLDPYDGHKIMQVDGTDGGIYLLTTRAVFYRNNTLADWVPLINGMPANTSYGYIRPFYRDKELRIATSRGVFKAEQYDTPQLSNALLQPTAQKIKTDCARDTFYFDDFSVVEHAGATWSWSFPDASYVSATNVRNPKVVFGQGGAFDVTMSITKNGQTYTKTVEKMITVGNGCSQVDEIAGKALQVHSTTNDRAITESFDVTTNTFSFSAWVKPEGQLQAFSGIFSNGVWCAHCNDETLGLGINYHGNRLWYRWPGSTSSWAGATNLYPQVDEWSYVAFVMSPNKVTVYLNEQKWESTIDHAPAAIGQLYMGFGNYTKYFNGLIDEATFWKRSLSEQEIKELMHLTKDPTADADLLAYYQFNEGEGIIFDKAGTAPARLLGGASRVISSAPIGGGVSQTASESGGNVAFSTANFEADFTNQSGVEVVASKINQFPYNLNGLLAGEAALASEYWAVHRYGSGDFTANLTFKTSADLTSSDGAIPSQFALYKRGNRSDEDWEFVTTASSVDAATDKITFTTEIQEWGQYFIAKSTQAILRANNALVLKNTAVGGTSPEKSYQLTATNLTADVLITAPIGYQISTSSGANFTNSLTVSPNNGVIETTIYVRFMPTEARAYNTAITHTSMGASDMVVTVSAIGFELDRFPGTALDLDGSSDYVNLGNPTELQITGDLTIQMWVKPTNFSARRNPIGKAYGGEYTITQNTDGTLAFYNGSSGGNSGSYQSTSTNQTLTLNEWQHITLVRDLTNQTVQWYVNGEQTNERTGARTDISAGGNDVYIGEGYVSGYAGLIDEVRIWKQALSATQIREQQHLTLKGTETNLVAYYQFNETSGDAIDRINGLNGTLENQATRSLGTEPVGGGYSNTQTEANGVLQFPNTGLETNFTSQNGAEIVVSKLTLAPNDIVGIGANETAADNQYWVVNRYGTGTFVANLAFTTIEDLTNAEEIAPTTLKLYGRNQTSDGTWILITTANSVDAANNKVTFNNITAFEQYLITRSPYPKIATNQTAIAFGNVDVNTTSELTYTVSATDLSNNLIITPPVGFDISLTTGTGFISNPNTLTISPNNGAITDTTIYVRFSPTNTTYQLGSIEHSSNGATNRQVALDGVGVQPEIDIRQAENIIENNNTIDFGSHQIGQDSSIIFTIKNEDLGTLNLSGTPIIEVVGANAIDFSVNTSSTATTLATGVTTIFEIKFKPTTAGVKTANISIANNDADEAPYIINLTAIGEAAPAITVTNLTDFSNQLIGTASTVQSYTLAGTALIADVILTCTPGFEISLNENSGFGNTLTLTPSDGSLNNTTIYVRFAPAGVADYNGVIKHVSTDAITQAITIGGSSSRVAEITPGKAITFNGTSDYVSIPNHPIFQFGTSTDFTVALWMKTDNWQNDASLASNKDWDSGSRDSWNIALATDGKGIDVNVGDGSNRADLQAGDLNDGEWHHIAATFDRDGAVSLYVDGVLEQSTSMAHVGDINSGLPLTFGRDSENEYFFDGMIDEAKIWNATLTAQEVREAMHITSEWNTPNLIAYYQFNETNYASVFNLTGSSHGTLYSGSRIASTAPVGGGMANTQTEANGGINFIGTDFEASFSSQNNADVVVAKINLAPNAVPTDITTIFDQQYWAVHRYGTGNFIGDVTFKIAEDLTDFHQNNPSQILLYGRAANSDATWQLVSTANSVDAANDKATFNNITTFDQYLLASLVTDFMADKTGTCLSSSIQFTDASDGTPTTWAWTFAGGSPATSTAQNPSITYNSSGVFEVTLVIDNGLATQRTITKTDFITVANELVPSIMATESIICLGESVNLTASGGMTYQWATNATLNTTTGAVVTATPTTTTTYTVTATDAAGCTGAQSIEITVNPLPTASLSGTTALCQGANNPNITFTGANGTAPYTFTYQINDGANQTITTTSGNVITLDQSTETAGTFIYKLVSVADANSCSQQQNSTTTITVRPLPTASISGTTTLCKNETAPAITFSGGNGTAPYTFTYHINDGVNQNITTTTGNEISLSQATNTAGTFIYTLVEVVDAHGCIQAINRTATITINELPTASISGTFDVYQNATPPTITFTGTNGTAPYTFTYQINDGTNQSIVTTSGNTINITQPTTHLGTFAYTLISVSDANDCIQVQNGSATIKVNALPTAGISGTTTICQNETNPAILFTSDQGVAPYTFTYKVNNGPNQTVTTTTGGSVTVAQPTNIAGTFVYELISIADANNGSQAQSGTATVIVNPLPTATISGTTNLCKDASATLVTFNGANGTAPYTFTYTVNGGSAQTITTSTGNMVTLEQTTGSAGIFTYTLVSVSDAKACSQTQNGTATITINELPTATISGSTSVYNMETAPALTFTGSNGVAPYTFTYTINDGANQTVTTTGNTVEVSQPTNDVGDFVYELVDVTDNNSCTQTQSGTATITVNALPTAGISGTTTVCLNAADPEIIFTSNEGIAPFTFTYTINDGINQTVTTTLGNSVAVAQATTTAGTFAYELVSIADANNASQTQSGSAVITVGGLPTANLSGSTAVCQNSENPVVRFTGYDGVAPYTFTFKINDGAEKTVTTTVGDFIEVEQDASEAGIFTYSLISVADGNDCTQNQTGSTIITVTALPSAAINTTTANSFRNDPEPEVVLTGTDGKAPYTFVYTMNDGADQTITSKADGTATISHPTTTEGTFIYALSSVTDANSCTQIQSGTSEVSIDAPPVPIAEISGNNTVCQNAAAASITFTGNQGSAPYTFIYKINDGANQTVSTTTGNQISVPQPTTNAGTFTYTLISVADTNYPAQNQNGTAVITIQSAPSVTLYPGNTSFCLGQSITTKAQGATSYIWSPTEDLSTAIGATVLITPMQTTTYQVVGTSGNGCKDTVDFTITVDEDCCPEGNLVQYENTSNLPTLTHTSDYIEAGNLSGNGEVIVENDQNITFKSNNFIQLKPGFTVQAGAIFTAKIEGCTASQLQEAPAEKVTTARTVPSIIQTEVKTALEMNVYPNPFETRFFIDYRINKEAQVTIQLFDLSGKKVQDILLNERKKAGTYQAKFTNLNLIVGTYILSIQVGNEVSQQKVVMSNRE